MALDNAGTGLSLARLGRYLLLIAGVMLRRRIPCPALGVAIIGTAASPPGRVTCPVAFLFGFACCLVRKCHPRVYARQGKAFTLLSSVCLGWTLSSRCRWAAESRDDVSTPLDNPIPTSNPPHSQSSESSRAYLSSPTHPVGSSPCNGDTPGRAQHGRYRSPSFPTHLHQTTRHEKKRKASNRTDA